MCYPFSLHIPLSVSYYVCYTTPDSISTEKRREYVPKSNNLIIDGNIFDLCFEMYTYIEHKNSCYHYCYYKKINFVIISNNIESYTQCKIVLFRFS